MKKVLFAAILSLLSLNVSAQVALKTEGQDSAYVQTIKSRAQKIVDGLGLTDAQKAENVRNIIANRYFLENEEYESEDWPDDETIARIYSLIKSELSPQARRVLELRFSEGLPFSRIAASMGISETAVYRHLGHALKVIRKKLNENG